MESSHEIVVAQAGVSIEPLVEILGAAEDFWKQKVEEGPEFMEIVLQWSSRQQESATCLDLPDHHREFALLILDPMSLVNDHVLPIKFLKHALLSEDHLVGGDADIPAAGHHDVPDEGIPRLLVTNEADSPEGGTPLLELVHPVSQGGLGNQHHVRSVNVPGKITLES